MHPELDGKPIETGFSLDLFRYVEIVVYAVLGLLLCITAVIALGGAAAELWDAVRHLSASNALLAVIDRLLLVFMLIEILHTIRASMRDRILTCEPFLIVALIATVRRVLVITLQSAGVNRDADWTPEHEILFRATMLELVVLSVLILVMVTSIYLLRRSRMREIAIKHELAHAHAAAR
jgi:uncharacterized membrane protein (DUF373 family)